jgi:hypothetical protein
MRKEDAYRILRQRLVRVLDGRELVWEGDLPYLSDDCEAERLRLRRTSSRPSTPVVPVTAPPARRQRIPKVDPSTI